MTDGKAVDLRGLRERGEEGALPAGRAGCLARALATMPAAAMRASIAARRRWIRAARSFR